MVEIALGNLNVTFFQIVIVGLLYVFNVGAQGICIGAGITSVVIAFLATYATWDDPDEPHIHVYTAFSALIATSLSLAALFYNQHENSLAVFCTVMTAFQIALFAYSIKKHWAPEPFAELCAAALPGIGIVFAIALSFIAFITSFDKKKY